MNSLGELWDNQLKSEPAVYLLELSEMDNTKSQSNIVLQNDYLDVGNNKLMFFIQ
jgi:hypothetical protein